MCLQLEGGSGKAANGCSLLSGQSEGVNEMMMNFEGLLLVRPRCFAFVLSLELRCNVCCVYSS